jgi:hypothetical protein
MRKWNLVLPLISCLLLVSCKGQTLKTLDAELSQASPAPSLTTTSIPASPTRLIEIPSPTATSTSVPPTLTPLPPIPTEEFRAYASDLLKTNGGCRLPCLWGIVPGETTWPEAYQFLATFSFVSQTPELKTGYATAKFDSPIEVDYIGSLTYSIQVIDGIVESIDFYNWPELYSWHSLTNVLKEYGPPDDVALYTEGKQMNGSRIAMLVLFYKDRSFMVDYVSFRDLKAVGDKVLFCPDGDYSFMYLWSNNLNYSFGEALSIFIEPSTSVTPRPLLEVSDMDIQTFYQLFQNPNSDACIETDLEAWPHFLG